ncbi:protein ANTAGONIST OF LIKE HETEROCHROMATIN PROTEIN 1-like [Harmonia axyridis]|uniref:protein ANTAGONIST OF LIKE HETEROCHROMATIN PROTEIN 1-like n=1 Tax=Harmonia axyridis TaxID=115357 RepID=UPI001E2788C9|nr:protein ANTAGONIST OF LIKE HETEROCHROMATIN PROTEIN 1-like [Harmonia axyridis]
METATALLFDFNSESDSEDEFVSEMLFFTSQLTKRKAARSLYLKRRKSHGEFALTKEFNDGQFKNYFRLNRDQFIEVHEIIKKEIDAEGCNATRPIGTEEKLSVFLRFMATGNSYKSMAYSYRMGDRTVSNIVREVSEAIWKLMQPIYLPQPTEEQWKSVANSFERKWQFPHCIGAIDGKHVVIKKPGKSGSSYINYKHTFSIVLMAVVDPDYKFITIDVGSQGRFSDGNVFSTGVLAKKMLNHTEDMPQDQLLPLESNNSRSTQKAFEIRENFKNYFNSAGAIPWQRESVARGKY